MTAPSHSSHPRRSPPGSPSQADHQQLHLSLHHQGLAGAAEQGPPPCPPCSAGEVCWKGWRQLQVTNSGCNLLDIHPSKEVRHVPRTGSRAGPDLSPCLIRSTPWCWEGLKARLEQPGRCLCPWQGIWNEMGFKVFSSLDHSVTFLCRTSQPKTPAGSKELNKTLLPNHFECLGEKVQMDLSRLEEPRPSHPFIPEVSHLRLLFCVSCQDHTNKLAPRC